MNRRTSFMVLAVVVVALTATACSDDSSTSTTSTAATATSAATTTATSAPVTAASTTSAVPASTTTSSPSTTTITALPTTTAAAVTTVDNTAAIKAAVAAAAVQSRQDYEYALENYDAADALDVLAHTVALNSPSWNLTVQNMETLRTNGWRSRANPAIPSVSIVESEVEFLDGPPATRAQLTVCTIDSDVVFKPGAGPDGSDVVVNDEVTARRNRITMVLEDGMWKLTEGAGLGSWAGATCQVA